MHGRKVKNKSGQPEHFIITLSGNQADRQWARASQVIYHEVREKPGSITNWPSNSIWSLSQTDSLISVWGTNTRWGPEAVWSMRQHTEAYLTARVSHPANGIVGGGLGNGPNQCFHEHTASAYCVRCCCSPCASLRLASCTTDESCLFFYNSWHLVK